MKEFQPPFYSLQNGSKLSEWDVQLKIHNMYNKNQNMKKSKNGLESGKQDILDNQLDTFHVKHKKHINKQLTMKKYEVIRKESKEYFYATSRKEVKKMVCLHLEVRGESYDVKQIHEVASSL